jgi:hypothetical protein
MRVRPNQIKSEYRVISRANANHCTLGAAVELRIPDCIGDSVCSAIAEPTERQRVGDEIDTAMIFAWSDFVSRYDYHAAFWGCVRIDLYDCKR